MPAEYVDLFAPSGLRLGDGGQITVEVPPRMSGEADGWLMACFHVETDQDVHGDHWEIHPAGQEVVSVLAGHLRLVLRAQDGAAQETVTLRSGTAYVVPRGRWHRLEVDGPTDLQTISPRQGSRLEARS